MQSVQLTKPSGNKSLGGVDANQTSAKGLEEGLQPKHRIADLSKPDGASQAAWGREQAS